MCIPIEYCFYFLLAVLCLALLSLLIVIFVNVNKFMKALNELLNQNKDNLTDTLNEVPELLKNTNDLVVSSKNIAQNVEKTVDNVSCFVEEKTSIYGGILGSIIKMILEFIPKFKK